VAPKQSVAQVGNVAHHLGIRVELDGERHQREPRDVQRLLGHSIELTHRRGRSADGK
jgi:hypothetical protein